MIDILIENSTWSLKQSPDKALINTIRIYNDNWNDYGYHSTMQLEFIDNSGKVQEIGSVKFLIIERNEYGFTTESKDLEILRDGVKKEKGNRSFISLGQDISYYTKLQKILSPTDFKNITDRLNDCVVYKEEFHEEVFSTDGFNNSLIRFTSAEKAFFEAKSILFPEGKIENNYDFDFKLDLQYTDEPVQIKFEFDKSKLSVGRLNAIVGKNGVGKTSILSDLAKSINGISNVKDGKAEKFPSGRPRFDRVIVISYSAFDKFPINKESLSQEREPEHNPSKEFETNINNYVYCGLHKSENVLKSSKEIFKDYNSAYNMIVREDKYREHKRLPILKKILNEILESEHQTIIDRISNRDTNELGLSSGQIMLINIFANIVAEIENESIILFDEPENHLHPNAISNLMRMISKTLYEFNSYAIIATHSPIIIQEIPSKYVHIFKRIENHLEILKPQVETLGNNITEIIDETFKVTASESNYVRILDEMIKDHTIEEIYNNFNYELSLNARIYLESINKVKQKKETDRES